MDAPGERVGYQQRGGGDARAWVPAAREQGGQAGRDDAQFVPRFGADVESAARVNGPRGPFTLRGAPEECFARFPDDRWSGLTAGAALVTALTGGAESAAEVTQWVGSVAKAPPSTAGGGFLDLHYLLYGLLLDAQCPFSEKPPKDAAKTAWRPWREVAVAELLRTQAGKSAGCSAGSWDPSLDPFGFAGGRVYATAMAVLALEAPNRFPRVWNPKVKLLPPPKK
jgi:hypothetical protein